MATAVQKVYFRLSQRAAFRLHQFARSPSECLQTKQFHTSYSLCGTIKLDMPSLSPTMEQGNIIKWHKKEGDPISPGDILCDIETDKAVMSMDTEEEGVFAKILVPENTSNVKVGTLIALMVEEGDDWKNVEIPAGADKPAAAPTAAPTSSPPPPPAAVASSSAHGGADLAGDGRLMGPSVKKLLQEYNIKAESITPSGPSGALLKSDVLDYISSKKLEKLAQSAAAPQPPSPSAQQAAPQTAADASGSTDFVDIPLTNMRRTIAKRLTESKTTIPHAYASIDSNMSAIVDLRKTLQADGVKVSVNDFIIKASAMALQRVPRVNAVYENDTLSLSPSVDISVAVATPTGLITPIVFGAAYLSVDQIGGNVKELAGRAKEGKLQPHEYQGGSFSISNLGMFGISDFTAVINPPQIAIMAVGGTREVPAISDDGNISAEPRMTVSLSYDSRALSEVEATRFLEEFRHVMQNPQSMLAGTGLDSAAEAFVF